LAFFDGNEQLLLHDVKRAVVRHLEVVDASHDTWQIVVRTVGRLARLAHDCEERRERFETYNTVSR
jgi:hypothetical protein